MRVAREHLLQGGLQGRRLGGVAVEHLVEDRHAVGCLHHAQQELPGDHALLGQAEVAYITVLLAETFGADGGQIVKDHREVFINERAQQLGHAVVDGLLVVHQGIHAAQQVLMRQLVHVDAGHADGLQPAQHAQLGVWVAQSVEDHHTDRVLDRSGEPGAPEDGAQAMESEFVPQGVQGPNIAQRQRRLEAHLRRITVARRPTLGPQQGPQQGIERSALFVQTPEGCDRALPGLAIRVAERLHQPNVAVTARGGDLEEHAPSIALRTRR